MKSLKTFKFPQKSTETSGGSGWSLPGADRLSDLAYRVKTSAVAVAAFAMTVLPSFKVATLLSLTGAATAGTTLITACNPEEPEPPTPPKPVILVPTAAGTLLTYAEWEAKGFPQIGIGVGGIKFEILAGEAAKFAARGVGTELVIIRPAQRAEVTIANPGEFAAGAEKIKEFLTAGRDSVFVTMPNNIPVTPDVAGIIDQKIITVSNVVWLGGGAFVPLVANQEIYGNLYENLPVGMNGDMRFYVPGKNDAHRIKYFINNGLINTDTISTSRFPTNLRAQREIYVNTGRAGTLEGAVDAGNFSGYVRTDDQAKHIPVITLNGKQLVLENATVDVLECFKTDVIRRRYNQGTHGGEYDWGDTKHGPNGPFHLVIAGAVPDIFGHGFYTDIGVKSMFIGKSDIVGEAGYSAVGERKGDGVLNMIEESHFKNGPIGFTIESKEIDVRWTNLKNYVIVAPNPQTAHLYPKGKVSRISFWEWVSKGLFGLKKLGATIKVTEEWCIVFPEEVANIFNYTITGPVSGMGPKPSPEVPKYMLDNFNIVLDHPLVPNIYPHKEAVATRVIAREPGRWNPYTDPVYDWSK